jgi:hypothetical protein
MIKSNIKIIFNVTLDADIVKASLCGGWKPADIKDDIKKHGLKSRFIEDYEVYNVEDIERG